MAIKIAAKVKKATVTFTTQAMKGASQAILRGEWDNWKDKAMKKNTDETFSVDVSIDMGKSYQFGYSIDGAWTTDADLLLVTSPFGTNNSILDLTATVPTRKSAPTAAKPAVRGKTTGTRR